MELLGYVAALLMGLSLGLIGGGGSILTVPILVYLFKIDPVSSTAYSLFIVGLTALVGGFTYLKKGDVDIKTGFLFATPSFIGVYLTRAFVVPSIPEQLFGFMNFQMTKSLLVMLVFAVLMVVASLSMIRGRKKSGAKKANLSPLQRSLLIVVEGLVVGGITGFVGAGGGFLIIPALVLLVGLPMKIAVGTSLMIIAVKSLIGFIGDLQHGITLDWPLLFSIVGLAVVGLAIGVVLSPRVKEDRLKVGFGWFVLIMGTGILLDQILKQF